MASVVKFAIQWFLSALALRESEFISLVFPDTLAKLLLSNVMKQMENEEMQETMQISSFGKYTANYASCFFGGGAHEGGECASTGVVGEWGHSWEN